MTANPRRLLVGQTQSPVLSLDAIGPRPDDVRQIAAALAPFPQPVKSYYPGVRRMIGPHERDAWAYVQALLNEAAPYIGGAFDCDGFDLIEASFSLVTAQPETLAPIQRAPHFDGTDPMQVAVLHYLADTDGTAFFRHRRTGIERVTDANADGYIDHARRQQPPATYITGSNDDYEEIGRIEGIAGRLAAYPVGLLHSGLIGADVSLSPDPMLGRLTCNLFIRLLRQPSA